jgi:propionate catabolism operon transcriptional regulator
MSSVNTKEPGGLDLHRKLASIHELPIESQDNSGLLIDSQTSERPVRIAFVSHTTEIGDELKRAADPSRVDVTICGATLEDAVPVAESLLRDGIEVIVGGWGTGSILMRTIGHPVIKIGRSHLDLLKAMIEARRFGSRIALTSFHQMISGVDTFEQLLGIRITQIVFNNRHELEKGIARASTEVDCVVGGGICKQIASEWGCPGVVAMPGPEAVLQTLADACSLAYARRRERHEIERLKTTLGLIKDGLVLVAADGRIEFANTAAREMCPQLDTSELLYTELRLSDVLKEGRSIVDRICRITDKNLVTSISPIKVDGAVRGAVVALKDPIKIHRIDRQIKEQLYGRGFVAKHNISDIKGSSSAIVQLLEKMQAYASTDANLLVEGETGVGKELVAQSLHNLSRRHPKPFVAVNCSALPNSLLETELFGYEEGAFTGARRGGKIGLFELAQNGTLFLDEIADVTPEMQAKLLRVLEEKEIMRVGGNRIVRVDVRVVSSTYRNLFAEIQSRRFRSDLYFRLATLHLTVPPLRARLDDIPTLVQNALRRYGVSRDAVSKRMLDFLQQHEWPGNVRELDSLIQRYAVLLGDAKRDDALLTRLFAEIRDAVGCRPMQLDQFESQKRGANEGILLRDKVHRYEQHLIMDSLRACRYNRRETARRLGISLNTLWRKMQECS